MFNKKIEHIFYKKIVNTKMYVLPEDDHRLEYYMFQLERLEKERNKITQRGPLSDYEDYRLDEIDDEAMYWSDKVYDLYMRAC